MSIIKSIERAYRVMKERNWDTIYWAIDLHGVCLKSNYQQGGYQFINQDAIEALKILSNRTENCVILWSSLHYEERRPISRFFMENGIQTHYWNRNPEIKNTKTGNFDQKFYFSVLLDDKAGFDPSTDWTAIREFYERKDNGDFVYHPGSSGNG